MPWCPVCKNEYREGIAECAECKVPLVESLSDCQIIDTMLFTTDDEALAKKFADYLVYSGLTDYDLIYNEEDMLWHMNVSRDDYEKAHKLFRGFAIAEASETGSKVSSDESFDEDIAEASDAELSDNGISDNETAVDNDIPDNEMTSVNEITSDTGIDEASYNESADELLSEVYDEYEEVQSETGSAVFVKKEDQYKDYKVSGYSCIIVGAAGFIFCLLNMMDILHIFPARFSQIVMLDVFVAFILGGIALLIKSISLRQMIGDETKTIHELTSWLELNITKEILNEITDDSVAAEVNYFKYLDYIKEKLYESFPDTDSAMAEALIEEHLTTLM